MAESRGYAYQHQRSLAWRWHIDMPLLLLLIILASLGLVVLYSAVGQNQSMMLKQVIRLGAAFFAMLLIAQVPPRIYKGWAIWVYLLGIILLLTVIFFGVSSKGAQRWLNLGFMRFQPSELIKLAIPMALAWYLSTHPQPPRIKHIVIALVMIAMPVYLIYKQPDLGTSIFTACSGLLVIFFAGIRWRLIGSAVLLIVCYIPIHWHYFMHDFQKKRVMTFLNPEADRMGDGYQIIQSKIAIGSGGLYGKGWLNGTQSQLEFIPERHNDFIFAVYAEEFGLMGVILLVALYLAIIARGLYIATQAQDCFNRLLAGAIIMTFFVYVFVNIGMVIGLLPVVGLPLPLVSYGGTSMVTLMAGFGILMSIHTNKTLHYSGH